MSIEQQIGALVEASNNLTKVVSGEVKKIDQRMDDAESEFDEWKSVFCENINGIDVFKQGAVRRYFYRSGLNNGGYTGERDGPDSEFPVCSNPQPPYFVNLLEFIAGSGAYGYGGDIFKIDYIQTLQLSPYRICQIHTSF